MSRVATLLLGVGLAVPGLLQAGVDTAWVRRYDGPAHGQDWATCIATDSFGNVYVAGTSSSDTSSGAQYLDFVTIKYLPNGDTAWVRRQDFGGKDIPYGLGVDSQGNVYVAGTNNDSRMATVKYSPTGICLWYVLYGSQGGAYDLALDSQGNVVVCGASLRASLDCAIIKYRPNSDTAWARFFDWAGYEDYAMALAVGQMGDVATTGFGAGMGTHYDCLTAKYDSSGMRLWAVGYDGPNHGDDRTCDVATGDSGSVVTGYGDNGYTTPYDYLTIKYGPQGETLWTRRYNGAADGRDEAQAATVLRNGDVCVTGFSQVKEYADEAVTLCYGSDGTAKWTAHYFGPGDGAGGYAVASDAAGDIYVAGSASMTPGSFGDCVTIKYDSTGETLWVRSYNGPANSVDYCSAIALVRDGSVCVTGRSYGPGGANADFVTIRYVQYGGVAEHAESSIPRFTVGALPNPFTTQTTVRLGLPRGGPVLVQVLDVTGRVVRTFHQGVSPAGLHYVVWDATDDGGERVPSGVYVVVSDAGGASSRVKVTVLE